MERKYIARKTYGKTLGGSVGIPGTPYITFPNPFILPGTTTITPLYFGNKRYELSDWLGNVRVVVSDKKVPDNVSGNVVLNYKPEVLSIRDYYAFGSEINERTFEPIKPKYRYGFNNKENDNEIYGNGNAINFGDRIYNSRLGVWWGVDAKYYKYPMMSLYVFAGDNPIIFVDRDGREIVDPQGRRAVEIVEGKITFTEYATEDIKTVVNAMMLAKVGQEQVMAMVNSCNKIYIKVDRENIEYNNEGKPYLGKTKLFGKDNEQIRKQQIDRIVEFDELPDVEITVYEKAIDLKRGTKGSYLNFNDQNSKVFVSEFSKEEFIGAVGVHESVHATDKESNSQYLYVKNESLRKDTKQLSKKVEIKPDQKEYEFYKEIDKSGKNVVEEKK
ncbi:MAG TPA: hypothetical protein PK995_07970 [Bacteroidia bacterium]|nr:hypothetical protein [Bacteroidia bacterium]